MIRTGTAGWSIPRALAEEFPGEGPHLARYARRMHCAEINTSFYRSHARETYAKWASLTPRGFRFAVKLPRGITHEGRLKGARPLLEQFLVEAGGLGNKLGPLLVQLAPSHAYEARAVRAFFRLLRELHAGPVVCEPRHASWFEAKAQASMAEFRIGQVMADPARIPAAALPGGWLGEDEKGTGATLYARLHGSPRVYWSAYESAQLRLWRERLDAMPGNADRWCIFDNTASGAALANALAFMAPAKDAAASRSRAARAG
jgi:uncharacterized protein YecE (DUF72 family)